MTLGALFFAVCTLACLLGAMTTVLAKSPIRSAVGLLVAIVGIAGLFLRLEAQFLAAIQLIVYAGAVVVLFVFVVMLLGPDAAAVPERPVTTKLSRGLAAVLTVVAAGAGLFLLLSASDEPTRFAEAAADHGSVEAVGGLIFSRGIVPFELATALLIVAVVGAIGVARIRFKPVKPRAGAHETRRLFHGPVHPRDAARPQDKEASS